MSIFYLLSVWVHILSAMIWVGGMFFLVLVNLPILKKPPFDKLLIEFLLKTGERFRIVGWVCFLLIILTGYINLFYKGITFNTLLNENFWLQNPFGKILGIKLLIFILILIISVLHDFFIGPKAINEKNETTQNQFRLYARWMGRVTMILALIVVWLAVNLVR
jgi:putative copper resistance protein D